ncbi:unnamed protein product [Brassica oleracea]
MSKPRESYELVLRWVVLDSLFFRSKTAFLGKTIQHYLKFSSDYKLEAVLRIHT